MSVQNGTLRGEKVKDIFYKPLKLIELSLLSGILRHSGSGASFEFDPYDQGSVFRAILLAASINSSFNSENPESAQPDLAFTIISRFPGISAEDRLNISLNNLLIRFRMLAQPIFRDTVIPRRARPISFLRPNRTNFSE